MEKINILIKKGIVKRKPGYLYYINREGDLYAVEAKKGREKGDEKNKSCIRKNKIIRNLEEEKEDLKLKYKLKKKKQIRNLKEEKQFFKLKCKLKKKKQLEQIKEDIDNKLNGLEFDRSKFMKNWWKENKNKNEIKNSKIN
ncbi:hypothetical protein KAI04_04915 [Candidatus Pacearchaeota archaeon]|nr:hypothetical protein [Candidatus Pacearchaeota archaeon]